MSTTETTTTEPAEEWNSMEFILWVSAFRGYAHAPRTAEYLGETWYSEQYNRFTLHPVVQSMVNKYKPVDVRKLAYEFPHISATDDTRLAYTRSAADGVADRQLVTSIGKYLAKHWPHVSDHVRRDEASLYTPDERIIVHTTPEMIYTVETGPRSCMASIYGSIPFRTEHNEMMLAWFANKMLPQPDWSRHPYYCYDPAEGWSMAQRWSMTGGEGRRIDGRALIYAGPAVHKPVFVRTYMRNKSDPVGGWSETDFALQAWLEAQGYEKVERWPVGAVLRTPILCGANQAPTQIRAPYIDGHARMVDSIADRPGYSVITHKHSRQDGFWCESTQGYINVQDEYVGSDSDDAEDDDPDNDYHFYCEDCDERYHDDDGRWVGRREDRHICEGCCDDHYTYVQGSDRHGTTIEYYCHDDDVEGVHLASGRVVYIDENNAPPWAYSLENGDWAHEDECVSVDDEYYHIDDERIVRLANYEYALKTDVVDIDGEYYLMDEVYEAEDGRCFVEESDRDDHNLTLAKEEEEEETT